MLAPAFERGGIDLAEEAIHAAVPAEPQGMRPRCRCQLMVPRLATIEKR